MGSSGASASRRDRQAPSKERADTQAQHPAEEREETKEPEEAGVALVTRAAAMDRHRVDQNRDPADDAQQCQCCACSQTTARHGGEESGDERNADEDEDHHC
jgi:hypothetical protein